MKKFGTPAPLCYKCQKKVFLHEALQLDTRYYHPACFTCAKCNSKLQAGKYASLENVYYCKVHYNEAFKLRGSFDFVSLGKAIKQDVPKPEQAQSDYFLDTFVKKKGVEMDFQTQDGAQKAAPEVELKPHYQEAYKFANIAPYDQQFEKLATYKEIPVPMARVFELDDFFSAEECQYYIQEAEKSGFESLSTEYPEEYRNNQRFGCVL